MQGVHVSLLCGDSFVARSAHGRIANPFWRSALCGVLAARPPASERQHSPASMQNNTASPRSACEVSWPRCRTRVGHSSIKTVIPPCRPQNTRPTPTADSLRGPGVGSRSVHTMPRGRGCAAGLRRLSLHQVSGHDVTHRPPQIDVNARTLELARDGLGEGPGTPLSGLDSA